MVLLYAQLVSAPERSLAHSLRRIAPYCDGFHLDVFEDSLRVSRRMLRLVEAYHKPVELHAFRGADLNAVLTRQVERIIFNADCGNLGELVHQTHARGINAGVCILPASRLPNLNGIDRLQVYCLPHMPLQQKQFRRFAGAVIGVEGSVTLDNAASLVLAGAQVLVSGILFDTAYPKEISGLIRSLP